MQIDGIFHVLVIVVRIFGEGSLPVLITTPEKTYPTHQLCMKKADELEEVWKKSGVKYLPQYTRKICSRAVIS